MHNDSAAQQGVAYTVKTISNIVQIQGLNRESLARVLQALIALAAKREWWDGRLTGFARGFFPFHPSRS